MKKLIIILSLLFVISCGGGAKEVVGNNSKDIETFSDNSGVSMKANFSSMEGHAYWLVELMNNGVGLGECRFEVREKTDKTPIYFENKGGDPICSNLQIDPSSTVDNLKLFTNYDVRYCLVDNGEKKCGEVKK